MPVGLKIHIRSSKTAQAGAGQDVAVLDGECLPHLRHQALQTCFKSTTWNQKSARMALHLCSAAQRTSNLAA